MTDVDTHLVDLGDRLKAAMAAEREAEARGAPQAEHDAAIGLCRRLAEEIAGLTAKTLPGLKAKALAAEWELAVLDVDCPEAVMALLNDVKAVACG
jgi:hypothetical protein